MAWFRCQDQKESHSLVTSLNNSFGNGGGLFSRLKHDSLIPLLTMLDSNMRGQNPDPVKTLMKVAGHQKDDNVLFLEPTLAIDSEGNQVFIIYRIECHLSMK